MECNTKECKEILKLTLNDKVTIDVNANVNKINKKCPAQHYVYLNVLPENMINLSKWAAYFSRSKNNVNFTKICFFKTRQRAYA